MIPPQQPHAAVQAEQPASITAEKMEFRARPKATGQQAAAQKLPVDAMEALEALNSAPASSRMSLSAVTASADEEPDDAECDAIMAEVGMPRKFREHQVSGLRFIILHGGHVAANTQGRTHGTG